MKALFTIVLLMTLPSATLALGEKMLNVKSAADAFTLEALNDFTQTITEYNKHTEGQHHIISSMKNKDDQKTLSLLLTQNNIKRLPKIKQEYDKAYITIGKHVVVFSVLSLNKGEIFVNDKKILLDGSNLKAKLLQFKKTFSSMNRDEEKFSVLSLLIPKVYANSPTAKLDIILMATVIKATKGFEDRGYCFSCADENEEQVKTNFNKMIKRMDALANKCESSGFMDYSDESEIGKLAYEISNVAEYGSGVSDDYEFRSILESKFKMLDSEAYKDNFTCGQLAYLANKEEIHKKFLHLSNRSKNALAGYLGSTSAGIKDDGAAFEKYIGKKCEAHARLMTCLATRSDYGKAVYNKEAGRNEYKRIKVGTDISEEYIHHTINK